MSTESDLGPGSSVGSLRDAGTAQSYPIECGGKVYDVHPCKMTIYSLSLSLEHCIVDSGYNGDPTANLIIKRFFECGNAGIFRSNPVRKFRGRELFEYLLHDANDFDVIEYPEPTEGMPFPSHIVTKAGTFKHYYFDSMADSIGNYPASQYHEYVSEITGYYKWQIPPISREADSIHYVHILDAWQKGLIKLKPYGEE